MDRVQPTMRRSRRHLRLALAFAVVSPVFVSVAPSSLVAQDLPASFGRPDPDPDFLFQRPRVSIGLRGGMFFHGAQSDLFDFVEERFTIGASDFRGASLGAEVGVWLGTRTELTLGLDGSRVTLDSEYRDFVEDDGSVEGLPIQQTTRLTQGVALSVGARYYIFDRVERLGQFVWLPRKWNAFVSGGGGLTGYELDLFGDFVDEVDTVISTEHFTSGGNAFFPFLGAGVEYAISDHTALMLEGRYVWGDDQLSRDFASDFVDPLDLSGARLTVGIYYRN